MKNDRIKIYTLAALSILIVASLFWLQGSIQTFLAHIHEVKSQEPFIRFQDKSPTSVGRRLENIQGTLDELELLLPQTEELDLIKRLEQLAVNSRLRQNLFLDFKDKKNVGEGYKLPITITLVGEYIDQLEYLENVNKLSYIISIQNINAVSLNSKDEHKGIQMILTGEIYGK